jgi:hypothetical protein
MPYRPVSRSTVAFSFPPGEWDLLVRLPGRVLVAATSAEPDGARQTVAEGLAGIEAIAAGRASPSRLVRGVVAAIYAEPVDDADDADDAPGAEELTDAWAGIAEVLAECRAASRALADRVPAPDAAAYRGWLLAVAGTVCAASRTGGLFGFGGERVSEAEWRFLDELAAALAV